MMVVVVGLKMVGQNGDFSKKLFQEAERWRKVLVSYPFA